MNGLAHERARELILYRDIEGISNSDALWLQAHLDECPNCDAFAGSLRLTAQSLRLVPTFASSTLVAATQARVRARAAELRDREARVFLIGVSFCLGLLWSAGSALLGWKLSSWLAQSLHIPAWIIASGLVLFWLLPAIAMGLVFLYYPRPLLDHPRATWAATQGEGEL